MTAASAAVPMGNSTRTNSIETQTGCSEGLEAAEKENSEEKNVGYRTYGFICNLFKDAVCKSREIASRRRMTENNFKNTRKRPRYNLTHCATFVEELKKTAYTLRKGDFYHQRHTKWEVTE